MGIPQLKFLSILLIFVQISFSFRFFYSNCFFFFCLSKVHLLLQQLSILGACYFSPSWNFGGSNLLNGIFCFLDDTQMIEYISLGYICEWKRTMYASTTHAHERWGVFFNLLRIGHNFLIAQFISKVGLHRIPVPEDWKIYYLILVDLCEMRTN